MTAIEYTRLPLVVKPLLGETLPSYISGLAARNRFGAHIAPMRHRDHLRQTLCQLTDLPEVTLVTCLPQLRTDPDFIIWPHLRSAVSEVAPTRSACAHCAAARGARHPVEVFASHAQVICPQHHRWIGAGQIECPAPQQFSVRHVPSIGRANRQHRRLIITYGRSPVHTRFHDALTALDYWHTWSNFARDPGIALRRRMLGVPDDPTRMPVRDQASWYPNVVALTAVFLRSDHAVASGARDTRSALAQALEEFQRAIVCGLRPAGATNPFHRLLLAPVNLEARHHVEVGCHEDLTTPDRSPNGVSAAVPAFEELQAHDQ